MILFYSSYLIVAILFTKTQISLFQDLGQPLWVFELGLMFWPISPQTYEAFHSHGGSPKWEVCFRENPTKNGWFGATPISGNHHILRYQQRKGTWLTAITQPAWNITKTFCWRILRIIEGQGVVIAAVGLSPSLLLAGLEVSTQSSPNC